MKNLYLTIIAALAIGLCVTKGDERDTQYIAIFRTIDQADVYATRGNTKDAIAGYSKAQTALLNLQKANPGFSSRAVNFRLAYVSDQIKALTAKESPGGMEAEASSGSGSAGGNSVKLLVPGKEPRTALRFHPKTGDKQSVEMTIKMGMAMKLGDANTPIKLPAMQLQMDLTVTDVSASGDIKYESVVSEAGTVDDADTLPQVAEAMKSSIGKMKGLTGNGILSSRGQSKGLNIKLPPDADPQLKQAMEQVTETMGRISTPFPDEPIGPGAKWEYKFAVKSQGMLINQGMTYELASMDADQVSLKLSITQSAPSQKVQNPALQGMKVDLTKLTGTGSGEITVDLGKIVPTQGNSTIHDEMTMGMNAGGQKQTMNMSLDANVTISSK